MRIFTLFCIVAVFQLAGCAGQVRDSSTDTKSAWPQQPWRIHCETEETYALDLMAVPGLYHGRWIWGLDSEGQDLFLEGYLEDGFFNLQSVRSADNEVRPGGKIALREYCLGTLERLQEGEPMALGRVRAARHSVDIDVPIVFSDESPGDQKVTRLVVFGDSLSDAGRLRHRLQVFPGDPYWLGRFSNGPIWADYLEGLTMLATQNHAFGGASVSRPDHMEEGGLISYVKEGGRFFVSGSLSLQVEDYIALDLASGPIKHPGKTVFVIWAGANDYISKEPITGLITTFLNSPEGEKGYKLVVDETIAGIVGQVKILHKAGANKFLLINLPDLGKTPIVLQNETYISKRGISSDSGRRLELSRRLTALTDYHNASLAEAINTLDLELTDTRVLLVDSQGFTDSIMAGRLFPENEAVFDYGFSLEALGEELVHKERTMSLQKPCYTGPYMGNLSIDNVCDNAHRAFFWDVIHPASYAHCWQAYLVGGVLADAGWIDFMPTPEEHRAWCNRFRQDGIVNKDDLVNTASPTPDA